MTVHPDILPDALETFALTTFIFKAYLFSRASGAMTNPAASDCADSEDREERSDEMHELNTKEDNPEGIEASWE